MSNLSAYCSPIVANILSAFTLAVNNMRLLTYPEALANNSLMYVASNTTLYEFILKAQ